MTFFNLNKKQVLFFLTFFFFIFLFGSSKLPVLDRDEARFASASKTMIENNEFIDIRIGDEKRYKKPVGIYWAQITSNYFFGNQPYDNILIYRLPSLLGVILGFLIIYLYISKVFNRQRAFLSIFFLISSLLSISEIHQAKTDGLLFLFVNICNLILIELIRNEKVSKTIKLVFWTCLGIGVLIKGPIIFIFVVIPLLIFSVITKKNLLKEIYSTFGVLLFLIISVPWFVLISIKSGGTFWNESLINDLLRKISTGQESHGFPPGYYSILIFIFFWPGSIFLISYLVHLRKNWKVFVKNNHTNMFLLLWFFIPFLIFELISTKLPHYVFPSYTAISILVACHVFDKKFVEIKYFTLPLILYPTIFCAGYIYALNEFSSIDLKSILIFSVFLIFIIFLLFLARKQQIKRLIISTGFFQFLVYLTLTNFLVDRLEPLWISKKISQIIEMEKSSTDEILNFGFNEPSLYFLTSHSSKMISPSDYQTSDFIDKRIIFIITDEYSEIFEYDSKFHSFRLESEFSGFNYSRGKKLNLKVYKNY